MLFLGQSERSFLVLEPGNELHLLEALPKEWTKVGMKTELSGIYIFFCIISLSLSANSDRTRGNLFVNLKKKGRTNPAKVIINK
jgi:hypothetical protein